MELRGEDGSGCPASSPAVHNVMIANTSKDTKPELRVRDAEEAGYPGYRLHRRIDDEDGRYVCRPDITYPEEACDIVHGCFCTDAPRNLGLPKTNVDYWREKFERNVERDKGRSCTPRSGLGRSHNLGMRYS